MSSPPTATDPLTVRLCVVHPSATVRSSVVGACPDDVPVVSHARAADLAEDPVLAHGEAVLVVALDPGRTSPVQVRVALGYRPHVLSISDLHLDDIDPEVDSRLPRRRLDARSLGRLLHGVRGAQPLHGHAQGQDAR